MRSVPFTLALGKMDTVNVKTCLGAIKTGQDDDSFGALPE